MTKSAAPVRPAKKIRQFSEEERLKIVRAVRRYQRGLTNLMEELGIPDDAVAIPRKRRRKADASA